MRGLPFTLAASFALCVFGGCSEEPQGLVPPEQPLPPLNFVSMAQEQVDGVLAVAADDPHERWASIRTFTGTCQHETVKTGGERWTVPFEAEIRFELDGGWRGKVLDSHWGAFSGRDYRIYKTRVRKGEKTRVRGTVAFELTEGEWVRAGRNEPWAGRDPLPEPGPGVFRSPEEKARLQCMQNLRRIGELLLQRQKRGVRITDRSGSLFLLQVSEDLAEDERYVFRCPGDEPGPRGSYAGPNWRDHPPSGGGRRVWACDAVLGGPLDHNHNGLCVLWSDGRVSFIRATDIEGSRGGWIKVGSEGEDPRFDAMCVSLPPPPEPVKPVKVWPKSSEKALEVLRAYNSVRRAGKRRQVAEASLRKAEEFASESLPHDALFYLAVMFEKGGDLHRAVAFTEKFVVHCQDNRNYQTALAFLVQKCGDIGEIAKAAGYLATYERTCPDKQNVIHRLHNNLGLKLLPMGRWAEAAELFESAVEKGSETAPQRHVECLWAMGAYGPARTKAAEYAARFKGGPHEKRYDTLEARSRLLGEPAPALEVEAWACGEEFSLEAHRGEVCMLYFWNMSKFNCEPIEKRLVMIYERHRERGLHVAGLSHHLNFDVVNRVIVEEGWGTEQELHQLELWKAPEHVGTPWPLGLLAGDGITPAATEKAYGYWMPPSYCVIDKKGVYRFFYSDLDFDTYAILGKVIEQLQAE